MKLIVIALVAIAWSERDGIGDAVAASVRAMLRQPRRDP